MSENPAEGYTTPAPVGAPETPMPGEPTGYLAEGGQPRKSIRQRFAELAPYRAETVEVEDVGPVEVRSLTLGIRNKAIAAISDEDGNADKELIIAALIIASTFDPETGEKVFGEDDIDFIQSRDVFRMDELGKKAMELNKMVPVTDEEKVAAEKKSSEANSGSNT